MIGDVSVNLVALAEALVTSLIVEYTSAHFLNARKKETNTIRIRIAAIGVVVPLLISGAINLIGQNKEFEWIADLASRIATMSCAAIVAAWHWFDNHESLVDKLQARIAQLIGEKDAIEAEKNSISQQKDAIEAERNEAFEHINTISDANGQSESVIQQLRYEIEQLTQRHSSALAAQDSRYRDEIKQLTQQHHLALAAAKSNATANANASVVVNVARGSNAKPISVSHPLSSENNDASGALVLTEESLALTIAHRKANNEAVSSAILSSLFGVSQGRIRQMTAWANRDQQPITSD